MLRISLVAPMGNALARGSRARMLAACTAALAATALAGGCSSSTAKPGELRTPGQAAGFVAQIAWGESASGWRLARDASPQAAQAWATRGAIGDMGGRLRGKEASWTCELAQKLVTLGSVGSITSFNENDVGIVTKQAISAGAKPDRIAAMTHDALHVPFRDLAMLTVSICGPPVR